MAITVDWANTYVISIPKADMTLVQTTPVEVRSLSVDALRTILKDLEADTDGMPWPDTHEHTAPKTVSGVTLARVVEIKEPYTITFEDDLYNVNIVGGNSNVSDRTNKNQVGVNTANSAGLQDPFSLQAASFAGEVTIDTANGTAGTTFPTGTRNFPVGNLADALTIAQARGIRTIRVIGSLALSSGDFSDGYTFVGDSVVTADATLTAPANVVNCTFENLTVSGVLDGNNTFLGCTVGNVTFFNGTIISCGITGPITLGGGMVSELIGCFSEVAGGEAAQYPIIDMGGAANVDLIVRDWHGGIGIENCTAEVDSSIDMSSGRVVIESDVSAGVFTVRGIADVTDNSTGTAVVNDRTLTFSNNAARLAAERAGSQRLI